MAVVVVGQDVRCPGLENALAEHGIAVYRGDHHNIKRQDIVAVVHTDPKVVIAATAYGVDAIIWDRPDNQEFSWHFRARPDDILAGLLRRHKEWTDRRHRG